MPKKNTSDKFKTFLKFHWLKILLTVVTVVISVIIIIFMYLGLQEWGAVDAITKQHTLAQFPVQFIIAVVSGFVFVLMLNFMRSDGTGRQFIEPMAPPVKGEEIGVHWSDVVGMAEAKKEAMEVVRLIRERADLEKSGDSILKGVLMFGPPGTGKTYLVKAIATESGLPFVSVAGSEFVKIFVGAGASRVRKLFRQARELAAAEGGCVIFIDEIDAVGSKRAEDMGLGGQSEYNQTLNQLLVELDGLKGKSENIVVFGATNMAERFLDPALMRPGRFDRKIVVAAPDMEDRKDLFEYYLSKFRYDKASVDTEKLARTSVGSSPAEIANMVREAQVITARNKKSVIGMQEMGEARERVSLGIKRKFKISDEEKRRLAFYEAGHILVTYLLVPTKDVFKATIIPRGKDIVSTLWTEKEDVLSRDKNLILAEIRLSLAGYACEKIKCGVTSDLVENDFRKGTELAHHMVWRWGMGKSGHVGCFDGQGMVTHLIAESLDRDVDDIVTSCLEEINNLLRENWDIVEVIADELTAKEELDYDQIEAIFKEFGKERPAKEAVAIQERKIIKTGVTWNDVIGMEDPKQEARDLVDLIRDRSRLQKVGGRIIKGLLMFGPPGCGKTYLASAMATEFGLPFLYKSGSEFIEMYVGVGAMRIRRMFIEARELARIHGGCIIFLDEIDAVGGRRSQERSGGQSEHNQTLNQLLVEMDGLKEKYNDYNIVVIGATNMPENYFDAALLRPGRFDRKIRIYAPNEAERKKLFEYYLSKVQYDKASVNLDKMARITAYFSAADVANLIHEAAILCVRNKKETVTIAELSEAMERVRLGLRRRINVPAQEKEATAYHEAGHAIITYLCEPKKDTFKVSIIPRERTLGVSWSGYIESEDLTKKEALADIKCRLGGYVAEKIKYGDTSAGVSDDFKNILRMAYSMVYRWGMGDSGFLGNFDALYRRDESDEPVISEGLKAKLDADVQKILSDCLRETEAILTRERALMDKFAMDLVAKEELNYDEMEEIFKSFGKVRPTTY
ncbi:MAG TPA: AAA family ATPase [Patescibacteria group bacterium]|nr:AAA family ATPase [Patescibacteria group bacterium]